MSRKLQERLLHTDGSVLTEWDDSAVGVPDGGWGMDDKAWGAFVRKLNAEAKSNGDNTRFRSVDLDD